MNKEYVIDVFFTARKTITVYALNQDEAVQDVWSNLDLPDDVRVKEIDIVDIEEEPCYED